MYDRLTLLRKYIHYYLTASNGKGHGTHSPFVFDFITQVLNNKGNYYYYQHIETLREKLKKRNEVITVEDFGAGSVTGATKERTIASIAKNAAKPKKYGQLFFRMANFYKPVHLLELGTSLGLSTAYMAAGNQEAAVLTMEGSPVIAGLARENFQQLALNNIRVVEGNFDHILEKLIQQYRPLDMVFVDGNHRKESTLRYFEQLWPVMNTESVIIFDDIHWSAGMEEAWAIIKADPRVMLSIDLFFVGLVFLNPAFMVKQHFSIRF